MCMLSESEKFVVELAGGIAVITFATLISVIFRSIRAMKQDLIEHRVEAERRLTRLEDFKINVEKSSDSNDGTNYHFSNSIHNNDERLRGPD
jgi:hypothetical protein